MLNNNNSVFDLLFLFHGIFKWQMFAERKKTDKTRNTCTNEEENQFIEDFDRELNVSRLWIFMCCYTIQHYTRLYSMMVYQELEAVPTAMHASHSSFRIFFFFFKFVNLNGTLSAVCLAHR